MGVLLTALLGAAQPAWSAQASHRSDAAQQVLGQSHRPRRQTFELARRTDAEARAFARHEYRIVDLPAVGDSDADGNGHVHRLALGWQRESATHRVRLAAALGVSSNALKYPKQLDARDLRPELAIERRIGDTVRLACRDPGGDVHSLRCRRALPSVRRADRGPCSARRVAMNVRSIAAVLSILSAAFDAQAQPSTARLDDLVRMRIEGDRSGACVQAARIELGATPELATAEACAIQRADRPPRDARFEVGSISKAFVGVLLAEMIERGELKLDEPLQSLLPPGTVLPANASIRLVDLVTHTSGLPALPPTLRPRGGFANPYADVGADAIYGGFAAARLAGPPPQPYAYSNWSFILLSDAAARRAGKAFDVLLRERALAPLGMNDTRVAGNDGLVRGRSSYGAPVPNWDFPLAFAGAGGIRSTLDDMIKFARAMLDEVPPAAPDTLKRALVASRTRLRTANERLDLAMAWHLLRRPDGSTLTFHNGVTGGFSSSLALDVERRRAAIVLADAFGGFDDLAFHLLDPKAPLAPPRRAVALDLQAAERAAGRYALAAGFILTIAVEDGRLYAQATGQGRFELLQDSRGDYYTTATELLIRFARDAEGRAGALTLFQGGAAMNAKRIE